MPPFCLKAGNMAKSVGRLALATVGVAGILAGSTGFAFAGPVEHVSEQVRGEAETFIETLGCEVAPGTPTVVYTLDLLTKNGVYKGVEKGDRYSDTGTFTGTFSAHDPFVATYVPNPDPELEGEWVYVSDAPAGTAASADGRFTQWFGGKEGVGSEAGTYTFSATGKDSNGDNVSIHEVFHITVTPAGNVVSVKESCRTVGV